MIGRSNTGVYHHVQGDASTCNGRSFRGAGIADESTIKAAPEHMFCKKCFCLNSRDVTRKGNALFVFNRANDQAA